MHKKESIYIYPNTSESYKPGGNSYIKNLIFYLGNDFNIVNKKTDIGLLDLLLKIPKCDIIYFNWIEDIPDRRYGFLQVILLIFLLIISKFLDIKIIWFIHNNISHSRTNIYLKKFIVLLIKKAADVIFSHSKDIKFKIPQYKFYVFDHPIETYQPLISIEPFQYDILIWGTVSPYKGISEFIEHISKSTKLNEFRILIAGKFNCDAYYQYIKNKKPTNVTILNKTLSESELEKLFSTCRYVLFTYNSPSVLSSAALCKTLSFGKEVIGPDLGSFKQLSSRGLLYHYNSFPALEKLLNDLNNKRIMPIDKTSLINYIKKHSWLNFAEFLTSKLNALYIKITKG